MKTKEVRALTASIWDAYCAAKGLSGMKMDGGSDAVVSERNLI